MRFSQGIWSRVLGLAFLAGQLGELIGMRGGVQFSRRTQARAEVTRRIGAAFRGRSRGRPPYALRFHGLVGQPPPGFRWDERRVRRAIALHFAETDHVRPWEVAVVTRRDRADWRVAIYCRHAPKPATAVLLATLPDFCSQAVRSRLPTPISFGSG